MICFPVNQSGDEMFDMLKEFAVEANACPNLFLVGTKTDLRGDIDEENTVSLKKGMKLAKRVNAIAYLECSTQENDDSVRRVFKDIAKHVSKTNKGRRYLKYLISSLSGYLSA